MTRDSWGSKLGFILAVAGSAIGLANIWRFPYLVGSYGGGAFVILYLLCLILIGFPAFISETLIGRTAQMSPGAAFQKLGGNKFWGSLGKMTILTGFIVSSFYSAVAGWILGYLVEALLGRITGFETPDQAISHYTGLMEHSLWGVSFHLVFMLMCVGVLFLGVREGIERCSKWMMPLLFVVLIYLVIKGLLMPNAWDGLSFLFTPDWSALTPTAVILALGQAFFTLSVGQGTLVTYGSYFSPKENLVKSCIPVVLMDTCVSLLSAVAVFTIVFSVGMEPNSGPGLIFHTLPWVFSQISGGYFVALMFFLLVLLAAMTSEVSVLEPVIAYLVDERRWKRKFAVIAVGLGAFILGVPSALSYSLLKGMTINGKTFLDIVEVLASSILIPLGGFFAVILVGWKWGVSNALVNLKNGSDDFFRRYSWLEGYFWFSLKFSAPILIVIVFLHALYSSF